MSPPLLKSRIEFLQDEEHFAVVPAGFVLWLDVDRPDLAAVLPGRKVRASAIMRVIEAEAGGTWLENEPALAMRGDKGRPFFGGAVDVGRNFLPVPVELLGSVGVVEHVDGNLPAFFEAQQRTRELPVVGHRRNDLLRSNFNWAGSDTESVIGRSIGYCSDRMPDPLALLDAASNQVSRTPAPAASAFRKGRLEFIAR